MADSGANREQFKFTTPARPATPKPGAAKPGAFGLPLPKSGLPKPSTPKPGAGTSGPRSGARAPTISCRATNPLSLHDDLGKVFLDEEQAKATTATRLFRNDELFDAISKVVIPEYIRLNRTGKFCMWSTGCSSGEEVYSMAMIVITELEKAKRPVVLEAFGTDINRNRIAEARAGRYTRPSRDAVTPAYQRLLERHCQFDEREVQMGDALRSFCRFTIFDMRNRPKTHTFHFIVCNHVMQYYDPPGQRHIVANLKAVLRPGGHLYIEGVTEDALTGCGLKKIAGVANLYVIAK